LRQSVVVATDVANPASLIPAIRAEVHKHDPRLVVIVDPMEALIASGLTRQRLGTTLMLVFGTMALVLAAIGIYGVIAFACAERVHEVATRLALGATPPQIFRLLAGQASVVVAVGIVVGAAAAYGAGLLVANWLYRVRPSDPQILALSLVLVLAVTILATVIPARRASHLDPAISLRAE
jgi:ABC-type antimicrobial peptide transport system permease subunit